MSEVTAVVATYGSPQWQAWGDKAADQITEVPVVRLHTRGASLSGVRNDALARVRTSYVCFVDGDDAVEPGYFDRALDADVIITPLNGAFPTVNSDTHSCEPLCLPRGNYIHIGAIASKTLLRSLRGFRNLPIYEDWDLWLRAYYAGATFAYSPGPSYLTNTQGAGGRNTALPPSQRRRVRTYIQQTAINARRETR